DLLFKFATPGTPLEYRRELDLSTAVATTRFRCNGVTYQREVFASYPDRVLVVHLSADKPGNISFQCRMTTPHQNATTRPTEGGVLTMSGQVVDPKANNEPGLKFESRLRVMPVNGESRVHGDTVEVKNADAATLVLACGTSFVNFQDISADPAKRCAEDLAKG